MMNEISNERKHQNQMANMGSNSKLYQPFPKLCNLIINASINKKKVLSNITYLIIVNCLIIMNRHRKYIKIGGVPPTHQHNPSFGTRLRSENRKSQNAALHPPKKWWNTKCKTKNVKTHWLLNGFCEIHVNCILNLDFAWQIFFLWFLFCPPHLLRIPRTTSESWHFFHRRQLKMQFNLSGVDPPKTN